MDNVTGFLLGVGPILIFAIVDTFGSMKTALISALGLAVIELVISLYFFGELDSITLFSFATLVGFAIFSLKVNKDVYFKFQPVVLSCLFGLALIIFALFDRPLFLEMGLKYSRFFPEDKRAMLQTVTFQTLLRHFSSYAGYALILHGGLTAWAAIKLNKWWWVFIRVVGFYILLFLAMQLAAIKTQLASG